jgi:Ca2+-binding RTX toxin-like protein
MTGAAASGDQRLVDADGNATIVSSTAATGTPANMTGGAAFSSTALGTSTLAQTRDAIRAVISKYFQESTNVSVKLGVFSTGARTDNVAYTSEASALAALDALTNVTGGTNYSAGLTALQSMIGTPANPNDGVQRVAYFITDGVPSSNATTGNVYVAGVQTATNLASDTANPAGSTGYQTFIQNNKIESYAVAVGPAVPNTTALTNVHSVDSDASDTEAGAVNNGKDLPLVVSDVSSLTEVLAATVPEAFGGNIGGAGGGASVKFGADGGYTEYIDILLDSADAGTAPDTTVRFTYNPGTNQITNNNNAIAGGTITGSEITLNSSNGFTLGTLKFNFLTGDYTYVPQGSVVVGNEIVIGFGIIDGDGDRASATNTIRIVDGKPVAVNDYDTLLPGTNAATKFFEGNVLNAVGTDGSDTQITGFSTGANGQDYVIDNADVTSIVFKGFTFNLTSTVANGTVATGTGGTYGINAGGELTWTSSTDAANVLVFHRDGYYKYTPPAAQTANLPQNATQTVSLLATPGAATGVTLGGYTRTANLNDAPNATVTFASGNGAGVTGGGDANNALNNLENLEIRFSATTHPQGVQNVTIRVNANSSLGNNGSGTIGALQYTIFDIAGTMLGQFASDQEGVITIPTQYSNIGRILIQPNSSTGGTAGVAFIDQVTFNHINVAATANVPDEVIQYTITDKDTTSPVDSSTANLTLHVVTNEYAGTSSAETINGSASNDLITSFAGNDVVNSGAGSDIVRAGDGDDTVDGGADDDQLYGGAGNDSIIGGTGNDQIYGEAGNDSLQGGDGADIIYGGAGVDTIIGGIGADIISGGAGNDVLTGGTGADVFKWELADKGNKGSPAQDRITDFDPAAFSSGGDVLDLRDLLSGENHDVGTGNLENYLHFEKLGNDTVIHISSNGEFVSGFNPSKDVQTITLTNVDLIGSFNNDQAIIQDLLTKQKLITD